MATEIHADRRDPETPDSPFDLTGAGRELLEQAREMSAGRAARTLTPGAGAVLKQTLLAVAGGRGLDEHRTNGPATLQVLEGEVTVRSGDTTLHVRAGQWAPVPDGPHDLQADSDAVVLLTVALPEAVAG